MAQMQRISRNNTAVYKAGQADCVMLHSTEVVRVDWPHVTLRTGGWKTTTTKARMNQAAKQWGLEFRVYAKDFAWYVHTPFGEMPFDGDTITFSLKA